MCQIVLPMNARESFNRRVGLIDGLYRTIVMLVFEKLRLGSTPIADVERGCIRIVDLLPSQNNRQAFWIALSRIHLPFALRDGYDLLLSNISAERSRCLVQDSVKDMLHVYAKEVRNFLSFSHHFCETEIGMGGRDPICRRPAVEIS